VTALSQGLTAEFAVPPVLLYSDLSVELPFTLTHPKPPESPQSSRPPSTVPPSDAAGDNQAPVDTNLIQLDTE